MKNKHYIFNVLIMPYGGGYMAMCKETGLIRQGNTLKDADQALFNAMSTLVQAVAENNHLEPSLAVGLPLRYRLLFKWTLIKMFLHSTMEKFEFQRNTLQDFQPKLA
jgi:predicted RNase H-like HicB family nuclease